MTTFAQRLAAAKRTERACWTFLALYTICTGVALYLLWH